MLEKVAIFIVTFFYIVRIRSIINNLKHNDMTIRNRITVYLLRKELKKTINRMNKCDEIILKQSYRYAIESISNAILFLKVL